jgi:hypothetical protein
MRGKSKKFLITTLKRERTSIAGIAGVLRTFCKECGAPSEFVGIEEAVTFTGSRAVELFRAMEAGEVHWDESPSGHLYLCLASLRKPAPVDPKAGDSIQKR